MNIELKNTIYGIKVIIYYAKNTVMEKSLLNEYFELTIKKQFDIDINAECEFSLLENLVSKKMIVAPTFSEKINENQDLKRFFHAMINEINLEIYDRKFIEKRISDIIDENSDLREIG